ncbi:GHKL domain-containing protein [Enterococcus gilvus]|uniref:sensor histidine kinase n=1 Tax=Enterococcus gilvus TaxID=160453 RepID=UPI003D6A8ED4
MEVTMSNYFILIMFCFSRLIFIWGFDFRHILNKKECLWLTASSLITIFFLLLHISQYFSFSLYLFGLLLNIYLYYKKLSTWLVSSLVISLKYTLLVLSWFLTFDLPRILLGLELFDVFSRMFLFHIVQQLILFIFVLIVKKIFTTYKIFSNLNYLNGNYSLLSIGYIINTVLLIFIRQRRSYPNYTDVFLLSSFMLFVSLILIFLFLMTISKKQKDIERIYLTNKVKTIEKQNIENIREFQHDYKNTLSVLRTYLEKKSYDEASLYLSELINYTNDRLDYSNISDIQLIPNMELQNYLLTFFQKCTSLKIDFSISVYGDPYFIDVNSIDFTRVLSIITNNALEACQDYHSAHITIIFKYTSSETTISVCNPYFEQISITNITEKGISYKKNHSGSGLHILKKILKENHSTFDIEYSQNEFKLSVTIPKSSH